MAHLGRTTTAVRLLAVVALIATGLVLAVGEPRGASAAASLHYLYGSGSATGGKRVTFRVELTEPAPAGGAVVTFTASDGAIPVPASVTVPAGESEKTFGVTSVPVTRDTAVRVTATYAGVSKSRSVLIKEPSLSSLSVQSVIRGGGNGKVIVRLSGRAPEGGVTVRVTSNRPSILSLPGDVTIPAGAASATLIVPAADVTHDTPVNVIALYDGIRLVKGTTVKHFASATPTPTETPDSTVTPSPSEEPTQAPTEEPTTAPTEQPCVDPIAEPTDVPTLAPTEAPTLAPTDAATEAPTQTATEEPTVAPTEVPTQEPTVENASIASLASCAEPTVVPTEEPTQAPTEEPTQAPTEEPTQQPTEEPTLAPTEEPTQAPTQEPTTEPTEAPTQEPTAEPTQETV